MPIATILRDLQIDLPACPATLVHMASLLADEHAGMADLASLIESDMALSAAVVRTLNSALYGLVRRVSSVQEACQYLGMAQVGALTYEISLRAAFPPTPPLQALWGRARWRGLAMGRLAQRRGLSPWTAHTTGLFAEAGRAVLMSRRGDLYGHGGDGHSPLPEWEAAEQAVFGVHQAALGSALCRTWMLSGDVADAVRARERSAPPWPNERPAVQRLLLLCRACERAVEAPPADSDNATNANDAAAWHDLEVQAQQLMPGLGAPPDTLSAQAHAVCAALQLTA